MAGNIPYIGSKISLITTSDIRYEGILYTLNREESTIAVQSVRSFGTEGRRCPEIPISNEIYDFIIFRGKDLKDLTVLQGAAPPAPEPIQDPYVPEPPPPAHRDVRRQAGMSMPAAPASNTYTGGGGYTSSASNRLPENGGYTSSASNRVPEKSAPSPFTGGVGVADAAAALSRQAFQSCDQSGAAAAHQQQQQLQQQQVSRMAPVYEERASPEGVSGPPPVDKERNVDKGGDKGAGRGRGKGGGPQKKNLAEVLRFHKRAEDAIIKVMKQQGSSHLSPTELRSMSEGNTLVYHFYLDFVNYCCPAHVANSTDEQLWEMLSKALKKHYEKEFGTPQTQKLPQPQRPNNTLGDFITMQTDTKAAKKANKATRGGGRVGGRGAGRGDKKDAEGDGSGDENPSSSTSWSCPRCTLKNENILLECAACGTTKQTAALWAEFPPLG